MVLPLVRDIGSGLDHRCRVHREIDTGASTCGGWVARHLLFDGDSHAIHTIAKSVIPISAEEK